MGEVIGEATSRPFAMVLGRKSYDILSSYWLTAQRRSAASLQRRHEVRCVAGSPDPGVE